MKLQSQSLFLWGKNILVALVLFTSTTWYFWPLIIRAETHLIDAYDGLLISTIMRTVQDTMLAGDWPSLLDGNFFYPFEHTLTYSDAFLTNSVISMVFRYISDEPVFVANTLVLLSQLLSGIFVYFLLHSVSDDRIVSLSGSLVYLFSKLRLTYLGHLHVFSIEWMVLFLLAMIEFHNTGKMRWMYLMWIGFALSILNSFLLGMFCVFVGIGMTILNETFRKKFFKYKGVILSLFLLSFLLFPYILAYVRTSRTFDYVRPITEVIHFSLSPEEVVTVYGSMGLYLLIGLAFFRLFKRFKIPNLSFNTLTSLTLGNSLLVLGISSFAMSFGPALHWMRATVKIPFHIPLPYTLFYYLVPGFQGFRTPSRWIVLASLLLLAWALHTLKQVPKRYLHGLCATSLLFTLVQIPQLPLYPAIPLSSAPQVYMHLKGLPGESLIEIPINTWGRGDISRQEVVRMHLQAIHGKKLVNGYSGFHPPAYEVLVKDVNTLWPNPQLWGRIQVYAEIEHALVHLEEIDDSYEHGADIGDLVDDLKVLYQDEEHLLLEL